MYLALCKTVRLPHLQPQRIQNYGERGESHCGGGEDGIEQDAEKWIQDSGSYRNKSGVVEKRPEKILLDDSHRSF